MEFLETTVYGNALRQWLLAVTAGLATYTVLQVMLRAVRGRLSRTAGHTSTGWDDVLVEALARTKSVFLLVVAMYAGTMALDLPQRVHALLETAAVLLLLFQGGIWLSACLTGWLQGYVQRELVSDPS
ncbi:MAG: hypothetical protein ACREME_06600, partial [Gemmatimonadales bacterium]